MWSSQLPFPSLCREEGQPLTVTGILDMQAAEGKVLEDFYTSVVPVASGARSRAEPEEGRSAGICVRRRRLRPW